MKDSKVNVCQSLCRLENGLEKLRCTASQVADLKLTLAVQEVELAIKNEAADKLIEMVGVETAKVQNEKGLGKDCTPLVANSISPLANLAVDMQALKHFCFEISAAAENAGATSGALTSTTSGWSSEHQTSRIVEKNGETFAQQWDNKRC